jgi:photosystem II stability/assembly factor-like uncharacterized protein
MKKLSLFTLFICAIFTTLSAQWRSANPFNGTYNDLFFPNKQTGFAVTVAGGIGNCSSTMSIHRTMDAGENWVRMNTASNAQMTDLHFIDAFTGWAVGASSTIQKTTDGGQTWTMQTSGVGSGLNDIHFSNANNGLVVGSNGIVRRSTNGGGTWTTVTSGVTTTLFSCWMVDANIGYFCGASGVIRKTTNGGTSWSSVYSGTEYFKEIWFADANNGFALTPTQIFRTTNGGSSWQSYTFDASQVLWKMNFVSAQTGYITSDPGGIYKTTDGGVTWQQVTNPGNTLWQSVYFIDEQNGFIGRDNGKIARTTNGGNNWTELISGFANEPVDIDFLNPYEGLILAGPRIYKTFNGSLTMREVQTGTTSSLTTVRWITDQIVLACGTDGKIVRSTDAGNTFTEVASPVTGIFVDMWKVSQSVIYAATSDGKVVKTINGGTSWTLTGNTGATVIRGISFANNLVGMISGNDKVYKTSNGGVSWQLKNLGVDINTGLDDIWMINPNLAYAGGTFGKLYKTFDGGETWNPIFPASSTNASIDEMYWLTDSIGYFARLNSQSITIDGGVNLGTLSTSCLANNGGINTIEIVDSIYGYSAGGISNVLHTWKPNTLWRCYIQDSIYCGNSRIFVGYNASGLDLNSKNIVAQLSDANGDFSNPANIGTFTITFPNTDPSGIITCQLPNNLNGNGYRIRVICNDPALISPDNGFDIRIQSSISPIVSLEANPSSVCDGAPVNLMAEVSAAGVNPQFTWTINGDAVNYQAENLTLDTLTLASTIGVTVTSSLACASPVTENASTTIQVSANPPAFAGSDTTLCAGESVQLGSENGLLVSWEPSIGLSDATSDQPIASPESTTIYQLTVQNSEGCVSYDTVQVVVNPQLPELTLVNSFEILTIAEELEGTFTWYLNGEVVIDETTDSLVIFAPGDYSLQFEDAFGCITTSNVFTVSTVSNGPHEIELEPIFIINSGNWQLDRIESEGNSLPVRLFDMNGKLVMYGVMNRSGKTQFSIAEQTHSQGVYVLEFIHKGIPQHIKFIIP